MENKTFAEEISLTVCLKRINAQENKTLEKKKIIHIKVPCLEPKISAHGEEALEGSEINIGHWQNSFTKISTTG